MGLVINVCEMGLSSLNKEEEQKLSRFKVETTFIGICMVLTYVVAANSHPGSGKIPASCIAA